MPFALNHAADESPARTASRRHGLRAGVLCLPAGAVAWQLYDRHGLPTPVKGRADGLPVWSLVAAFAQSDGRLVLIF
jgi:hypothetical protein